MEIRAKKEREYRLHRRPDALRTAWSHRAKVFGLDPDLIRTLIYLKLSVSGHLTIFVTRSRGPFWSRPAPAPVLLGAVLGTQAVATVIAVYGALMTPLGWGWAAVVWGYALFWFLIEDRVKLVAHRWLDRHPGGQALATRLGRNRGEQRSRGRPCGRSG